MAGPTSNIVGLQATGSDGASIGAIVEQVPEGFTVERGHVVPRDIFIPSDEIVRVESERVVLREPAAYYRAGGDMDDGHWTADTARRARLVRQAPASQDIGLPSWPGGKH